MEKEKLEFHRDKGVQGNTFWLSGRIRASYHPNSLERALQLAIHFHVQVLEGVTLNVGFHDVKGFPQICLPTPGSSLARIRIQQKHFQPGV